MVNNAVAGQPVTPADVAEGIVFGAVGAYAGEKTYPLRGFRPYKLENIWNPGIDSLRLYGQSAVSGFIGLYQGLLDSGPACH